MSEHVEKPDSASGSATPVEKGASLLREGRVLRTIIALRGWAFGHWLRSVVVTGIIISLIAITMAGWAYLATVALKSDDRTLKAAIRALDEGRSDEARAAVNRMLKSNLLPKQEYGGPLYVLGVLKTLDAEEEQSADRRRIEYLVASRYLQEARSYGMPPERERDGCYLLGKSLLESGQFAEGLLVLNDLVAEPSTDDELLLEAKRYLAEACFHLPNPKIEESLRHISAYLNSLKLNDAQRAWAQIHRAKCYARMQQFENARESLAEVAVGSAPEIVVSLARAKIFIDELQGNLQAAATDKHPSLLKAPADELAKVMRLLQEASAKDLHKDQVARQAAYEIGRLYDLKGEAHSALQQHVRTRQLYSDTFEGLAAALAEANLLRCEGDYTAALLAYRRVMEFYRKFPVYRSVVLPLPTVRQQIRQALKDYIERKRFEDAITLVDQLSPLFSRAEQWELRGGALESWGNDLLSEADEERPSSSPLRSAGLQKLRAAGVAFEQLAELHYATRFYTSDLWRSAECYFAGHSFTSTARLLNLYLDSEPEMRNAQALLKLGQSYLAVREIPQSIAAFEECIEFHPLDSATFQARIDCAKAYWHKGDTSHAEKLLRENLVGSSLKPTSREWKDSLFELGALLHETGQYEQAIIALEEAIERYPSDSQRLTAQYLLGESYRRWGNELLERAGQTRTNSEREQNMQLASERLSAALQQFEEVQVSITLKTHDLHNDPVLAKMLRNCYMLEGTVLFDLGRFKEAIEKYSDVASLYPNNPFVLETFVQIANCWRRLGQDSKARGAIRQAQIVLEELPANADFASTTVLNRDEWGMLLTDMSKW